MSKKRLHSLRRMVVGGTVDARWQERDVRYLIRKGELPRAVHLADKLYRADGDPSSRKLLDAVRGMARSVDTKWLPRLPGRPEPLTGAPPNRIAHLFKVIYPFESTGGSIRNLNTIVSQKEHGLDPYVITPIDYPRNVGKTDFPLEHEIRGVKHFHFDFTAKQSHYLSSMSKRIEMDTVVAASVIRRQGAALIHAASGYNGYDLALKGLALGRHFSLPVIYEARSFHEHTWTADKYYAERSVYTDLRKAQENRCMRDADHVVTIADAMRTAFIERGVPSDHITVIPNAIAPEKFTSTEVDHELRARFATQEQVVVGYISNMSRREGHDVLLQAVEQLVRENVRVVCLLVGDGSEREALEALAGDLGIAEHVHFTGNVDHALINGYYSVIDIFVVPRRRDYAADFVTPLKPFEAMAMKTPLVMSDRPALQEITGKNEERGLVFDSECSESLASKLRLLIERPAVRTQLAERGYKWVMSERTWTQNAKRYAELYSEVIERFRG